MASKLSGQILFIILLTFSSLLLTAQEITTPEPYGGVRLLREFIREEIVYPPGDLENRKEGIVELSFVVKPDGTTSDLNVERSLSPDTDLEAIRIFNKILWHPCKEIGNPVACLHFLRIKFDTKKYQKYCKARGYTEINYPHIPVDTTGHIYDIQDTDVTPKPVYNSESFNFNSFVVNHLKYPEAAFKQNVSGTVKLKFVVEPSGRISNIMVIKGIGGGCTEEAIRVVRLLKWHPGIIKEMASRTFMSLDITFDMAKQSVGGPIPLPGQVQ